MANFEDIKEKAHVILNVIFGLIKEKYKMLSSGNGSWNYMLYGYGFAPAVVVTLVLQKYFNWYRHNFFMILLEVFLCIYFSWHCWVINKTLKVQPQYRKPKKPTKKELYNGKSKAEIKEMKKQSNKVLFKKAIGLEPWDSTPMYMVIGLADVYVAWTMLFNIIRIFQPPVVI